MTSSDVLAGKVAVVSGGARGQGVEEGRLFQDAGATVVLADVLDSDGSQAATKLGATYSHLDVTSEEEWDAVIADVVRTHGRLDVMVNNAGILRHNQLVNETLEQWQQVISVNQTGVFLGMRAAAKAMIAAGNGGSIINISSLAGLRGSSGSMAYCASKWAVRGMTKVAAKELGRYGIRVNSIHPGLIATDMTADFPEFNDDERRAERLRTTPLGRFGTPNDVANIALFLASEASSYCTGQEFVVDGGVHS
jgi:3alpha(or 20beta)-hydroxysteroid dehydrogenase